MNRNLPALTLLHTQCTRGYQLRVYRWTVALVVLPFLCPKAYLLILFFGGFFTVAHSGYGCKL